MSRKIFIKDEKRQVYIGHFPPPGGWQPGRNGIRRKLCDIADIDHLEQSEQATKLTAMYNQKQWEIHNAELVEKNERQDKKKQLAKINMRAATTMWLDEVKLLKNKKTYRNYQSAITHYFQCFKDHPLKDFDREKNIQFYNYLANEASYRNNLLSKTTQNTLMRYLETFLRWCYDNDLIDKLIKLKRVSTPKKDMETYTIAHLQTLKAHIENRLATETVPREIINLRNMRRAFAMATLSLLRIGAIDAMLISWISLEDRLIRVRNNEDRDFENKKLKQPNKPINDQLYAFLVEDLANRNENEIYFLDNGNGEPWYADSASVSKYATKMCEQCSLPKLKPFHWGMRATMITWLLNNGSNPTEVQQLADHDDIQTTMKYLNSRTVKQQNAVNALPII